MPAIPCPQCLPSDIVPIRSWTRTLRPPGIRHRHLPYHTIPYHTMLVASGAPSHTSTIPWHSMLSVCLALPYFFSCIFTDLCHNVPYHSVRFPYSPSRNFLPAHQAFTRANAHLHCPNTTNAGEQCHHNHDVP